MESSGQRLFDADLAGIVGECSLCAGQIIYTAHEKLDRPTGWVWNGGPGGHLQPVCGRCKARIERR